MSTLDMPEYEIKNPSFQDLRNSARTKTIATLGPVSFDRGILVSLIRAGVDIFRLNMAHGNREKHQQAVADIRWASQQACHEVAILVDLAGPKIRLGQLVEEPFFIETGSEIRFVRSATDDPRDLTCSYEKLVDDVHVGDPVMLCDGTVRTIVISKHPDHIVCQVVDGGEIRSRQGVNLPGANLSVSALGEIDRENALWATQNEVDFVSLSFVRTAAEVQELKKLLAHAGSQAFVIAKIEKPQALENIVSIVEAADGIMVARGDLGVEIDIEKTPLAQKKIIKTCQRMSKPVIVATQMLESMRYSKSPTRAEASDVANAILDGADACMLSGETAIGQFPVESVKVMQKIMVHTEQMLAGRPSRYSESVSESGDLVSEAMIKAAASVARSIQAKVVVIATASGQAALVKSKQRDFIPTIALTNQVHVLRRLNLFWGIRPLYFEDINSGKGIIPFVQEFFQEADSINAGDQAVFLIDTELWPGVNDMLLVSKIA
jgi:pyruvate kinase